jgi:hypothetical protein
MRMDIPALAIYQDIVRDNTVGDCPSRDVARKLIYLALCHQPGHLRLAKRPKLLWQGTAEMICWILDTGEEAL